MVIVTALREKCNYFRIIADQLLELQIYSMKFNDLWSPLILRWLIEFFMRLISILNGVIKTRNAIDLLTIFTKVIFSVAGLNLYADVYRKVKFSTIID